MEPLPVLAASQQSTQQCPTSPFNHPNPSVPLPPPASAAHHPLPLCTPTGPLSTPTSTCDPGIEALILVPTRTTVSICRLCALPMCVSTGSTVRIRLTVHPYHLVTSFNLPFSPSSSRLTESLLFHLPPIQPSIPAPYSTISPFSIRPHNQALCGPGGIRSG